LQRISCKVFSKPCRYFKKGSSKGIPTRFGKKPAGQFKEVSLKVIPTRFEKNLAGF
jgi:hypothetical protein